MKHLLFLAFFVLVPGCVCCPQRCDEPGPVTPGPTASVPTTKTGTIPYSDAGQ